MNEGSRSIDEGKDVNTLERKLSLLNNRLILPEEEYIKHLTCIIQRDYYPALLTSSTTSYSITKNEDDIPKDIIPFKQTRDIQNAIIDINRIQSIEEYHTLVTSEDNIEFETNHRNDMLLKQTQTLSADQFLSASCNCKNSESKKKGREEVLPSVASDENEIVEEEVALVRNSLFFTPAPLPPCDTKGMTLHEEEEEEDRILMPPPLPKVQIHSRRNIEPSQTRFPNQAAFYHPNTKPSSSSSTSSSISSCYYSLSSSAASTSTSTSMASSSFTTSTSTKSRTSHKSRATSKKENVRSSSAFASALRESYNTPLRTRRRRSGSVHSSSTATTHATPILYKRTKLFNVT